MKFTIAYSLVFLYVLAAIVFWGYSLHRGSERIYHLEKEVVALKNTLHATTSYDTELHRVEDAHQRRRRQYWGEGTTFLVLTLLASGIVYYAYYRQRQLSKLQQNFMLSVTHELKTPLAGIKLNMQTLQRRKLDEEVQQKLIRTAVHETDRLNDLCNNILMATQMESKKEAMYSDAVKLQEIIQEEVAEFRSRYPDFHIETFLDETVPPVRSDHTWWKLILSNLVENARKYTEDGGAIQIRMHRENQEIVLQVCDQGPGIPDEEKQKIFSKFYRTGEETTRKTSGTGLGLYLVRKMVSLYKYDITVKNNTPKGSIFEIRIRI
ncbi:MAG: HAMP domain-containing histidine kinase [Chitinophagaceae bacterium]|nr:HAMP domain-containing histidine kinase [Chitinophagaceae bacterium]